MVATSSLKNNIAFNDALINASNASLRQRHQTNRQALLVTACCFFGLVIRSDMLEQQVWRIELMKPAGITQSQINRIRTG